MSEHFKFLVTVYARPAAAMSGLLDRGSLLFASLAALAVSAALSISLAFRFYTPLLVLAIIYVPGVLLLAKLAGGVGGSPGTIFQRDYSALLTCTAMVFAAAFLPAAVAAWLLPPVVVLGIAGAGGAYFAVLMFFAVRTVFGTGDGGAAAVVGLSWLPLVGAVFLWGPLQFVLGWLASPFFLFFAYYYLGAEFGRLGAGLRARQHFRRMLDAAAVNPHDADAQYQLGLIYQQRRNYTEASERFRKAVAIHPGETDAHFQLGRIAREQGRLKDALGHFQTVVDQDDRHSQNEILRELAAVYLAARQYRDALHEAELYVERRPYDPEGLYYCGQALEGVARPAEARAMYARAVEAARSAPRYRRHITARWSRLAQKQMKRLSATEA